MICNIFHYGPLNRWIDGRGAEIPPPPAEVTSSPTDALLTSLNVSWLSLQLEACELAEEETQG